MAGWMYQTTYTRDFSWKQPRGAKPRFFLSLSLFHILLSLFFTLFIQHYSLSIIAYKTVSPGQKANSPFKTVDWSQIPIEGQ